MAYSNNYNNSNDVFTPTIYCPVKFFNSKSGIDNSCLSFRYWQNLLVISMNPIIVKEGSNNKVDTDNNFDIYLSPMKASILLNNIKGFRKNPGKYDSIGVNTNKGIIYLADGHKCFNLEEGSKVLVIKKIDSNNNVEAECAYEFYAATGMGIADFSDTSNFVKTDEYNKDIELDMFCTVLSTFVEASTSAMAASVMEANKYNSDRQYKFMQDVKSKLGIESSSNNNNNSKKNFNTSSWFNSSGTLAKSDVASTDKYEDVYGDIASIMD